ncbi:(2Fe-2S)-binding protein [Rhizorhabdus dicambivorans]|uniref:(2Fe-2S)-binding protein n=2 Tax=Rhizorhabdus dicambivorans TaxID=1850238 RepID=A0A2A4FZX1_9SPHN|nr:2Fe-2S iron-sulfur cluster-binding protein [Rhizorhabdus dicambivorans]ATE66506.1 (2Fe-2S)-binding protein [Rhizorhabdus dicambivorans]PCE44012.1 (2Fe-2S)-binding protein [Rhizorhabdus dicambivorans]
MIAIRFVSARGEAMSVAADSGFSLMEVAKRNGIPGIVAECGGACACATCHVHIDPAWLEAVGDPTPGEADMLDFAHDRRPDSRLSCQIRITPSLDGLIVHVPERQG